MRIKFYTDRSIGVRVRRWLRSQGEQIVQKDPDLIISCYNPKIIPKKELTVPAINFHPGYLPWNKGMFPHIWPVFDGSPAGVTIHYMTDEIDAGPIIAQKRLTVKPNMTAGEFEKITHKAIFDLFKKVWPKIKAGYKGKLQKGVGSKHLAKEIATMQEFDKAVIRRLAACTFDDRSYGYFTDKGKKYYVGVKFFAARDIKRFERNNHV